MFDMVWIKKMYISDLFIFIVLGLIMPFSQCLDVGEATTSPGAFCEQFEPEMKEKILLLM